MRAGALPLYRQIAEGLFRDIAAGRLADGARLPPEREMAAGLGLAVGTLRQALKVLAEQGMLVRVQGSGNYIRAVAAPDSIYALFRLERPDGGGLPGADVISVDRVAKDPALPPFGTTPDAHRIRRLRHLSGDVVAVEEVWLDGSVTPRIAASDLSDSLYLYYREVLGLRIQRAEDRVRQGALPDWSPQGFPYPPGTLLPMITRVAWSQSEACIEVSQTWFDPARAVYVARLR